MEIRKATLNCIYTGKCAQLSGYFRKVSIMGQREDGPLDPVIQFITFLEGIHEIITWFSSFCRRQKRVPYSFPSNTLTCSCSLPLLSHKPGDTCYAQGLLPTLPETLNARGVRRVPELPAFLVWTILSLLLTSNHMGLLAVLTGHVHSCLALLWCLVFPVMDVVAGVGWARSCK